MKTQRGRQREVDIERKAKRGRYRREDKER